MKISKEIEMHGNESYCVLCWPIYFDLQNHGFVVPDFGILQIIFIDSSAPSLAVNILMSQQIRRLQIWLLQLHIRKQMAIGGKLGAMLAVWDIASN